MIIKRGCAMAKPELSCEQMEVQVGRLTMRIEREMEGAARLDKSGEGTIVFATLNQPDKDNDILLPGAIGEQVVPVMGGA